MRIEFQVPAVPVAEPRKRVGKFRNQYTPSKHKVHDFKATVKLAAAQVWEGAPTIEPVKCDVVFVLPRPKSLIWKTRDMPRIPHTKKPDRDNLDKAVLDSLSGLIWKDDCQVWSGTITKWIASGDEQPYCYISLYIG